MRPNNGGNNFNRRQNRNNGGNYNNRSGGNNMRRPQQPQNLRNQIFDSHGPNGERVRGNAFQVHEKYQSLARDAEERVDQEAYSQFAEHYYRIIEAIQEMEAERNARFASQQPQGQPGQQSSYGEQPGTEGGRGFGEQPELGGGEQGDGSADGRGARQEQSRDQGRRGYRDERREPGRELGRERYQPAQADAQSGSQGQQDRSADQPLPPRERNRRPLEPINHDEAASDDDSGPIFSLADKPGRVDLDIAPDGAADAAADGDEAPKPRRRGRPAKAKSDDSDA